MHALNNYKSSAIWSMQIQIQNAFNAVRVSGIKSQFLCRSSNHCVSWSEAIFHLEPIGMHPWSGAFFSINRPPSQLACIALPKAFWQAAIFLRPWGPNWHIEADKMVAILQTTFSNASFLNENA